MTAEKIWALTLPFTAIVVVLFVSVNAHSCHRSDNELKEYCIASGKNADECIRIVRGH